MDCVICTFFSDSNCDSLPYRYNFLLIDHEHYDNDYYVYDLDHEHYDNDYHVYGLDHDYYNHHNDHDPGLQDNSDLCKRTGSSRRSSDNATVDRREDESSVDSPS